MQLKTDGCRFCLVCNSVLLSFTIVLCGCRTLPDVNGSDEFEKMLTGLPTVVNAGSWDLPEGVIGPAGRKIVTRHYEIMTTVTDRLILRRLPMLLESAFISYGAVIDRPVKLDRKLSVYLFDSREQWEQFTSRWDGVLAPNYLKIKSGAYFHNGACVAYHIGRTSNFAVLAHEGWHQYAEQVFQYNLPAWLNEGMATGMEGYNWKNGSVDFHGRYNASRLMALQQAVAQNRLFKIDDLLTLDAGRVLSRSSGSGAANGDNSTVAIYYAQIYALNRFLREYDYGYYQRDFNRILTDAYLGRWPLNDNEQAEARIRTRNPSRLWNGIVGKKIFYHYIGSPTDNIEARYRKYCAKIASNLRFEKLR